MRKDTNKRNTSLKGRGGCEYNLLIEENYIQYSRSEAPWLVRSLADTSKTEGKSDGG